jgi:hypothetical protein
VGWNGSAGVNTISDSNNNRYNLAIGPTSSAIGDNQSIYYAAGIKPGANTVTVTFTGTTNPDVRILEYSGINNSNPIDVTAVSTSDVSNDGHIPTFTNSVKTTFAPDLIFAANTGGGHNTAAGLSFKQRMITRPGYNLAEDRIATVIDFYSGASDKYVGNGDWVMQMVAFRGAIPQAPDNTAPTVSIVNPGSGTGTVTITVNASDNSGGTGVASVLLFVDGVIYGTADVTPPYTFALDMTKFRNTTHTLLAEATDAAGNSTFSAPVSLTFSNANPGDETANGVMSGQIPLPIVSLNLSLLPDGSVLMNDGEIFGWIHTTWNPLENAFYWVPTPAETNMFCTGNEQLGDGRILIVGGQNHDNFQVGINNSNIFDPSTFTWTQVAGMNFPRWYPTVTMLDNGNLIVTNGEAHGRGTNELIPEIYNPAMNVWTALSNSAYPFQYYYPHTFLLPDGRLFAPSTEQFNVVSQVLDLSLSTPTWTPVDPTHAYEEGTAVMYLPGQVLRVGTHGDPDIKPYYPSGKTAYTIDTSAANPAWQPTASMQFARIYANSTLLPDGTVLVTGGGASNNPGDTANAVLPVELWSPTTGTWTTLASMSAPRLYHSEALLLPDGRVFLSGGGRYTDTTLSIYQFNGEFFAPPYLFKGPRPSIDSAPSGKISYGSIFSVTSPDAGSISAVNLVRFGSVTHAFNMAQRFVPLNFTVSGNTLNVTAPASGTIAPPGNYLLFILNGNGVPSVAATVRF